MLSNGPGQQFVDLADRMVGDVGQHVAQVRLGVDAVELAGADQGVDCGSALATAVRAAESTLWLVLTSPIVSV